MSAQEAVDIPGLARRRSRAQNHVIFSFVLVKQAVSVTACKRVDFAGPR